VKLALTPFQNQWWNVGLTLTTSGLTTGPVPWSRRAFSIDLDFPADELVIRTSDGDVRAVALEPRTVKDFYAATMTALAELGIEVAIDPRAAELEHAVRLDADEIHSAYDGDAARRWWRACLSVQRVLERFRTSFGAKTSPVLLYWGGMDLNLTRFNGQAMQPPAGAPPWLEFGEDAANVAFGFWPGSRAAPYPVLYAYGAPAADGIAEAPIAPEEARWDEHMGEFILPYDVVRVAPDPDAVALEFFESVYHAHAAEAGWDTASLAAHVPPG
jgi:hypothetical protein